ncbi:hypothetical protein DFS34DRAFT_256374 [Phlyctochytrium arcticum]|nr:hypothetical protein DFS34DRAFT_256374 [Phlyctochytrium arcticum]
MTKGKQKKRTPKKKRHDEPYAATDLLDRQLAQCNLQIKDMTGDGNCLFRALSDQYSGSPQSHQTVRNTVCDTLLRYQDDFAAFVSRDEAGSFEQYVERMRRDGVHGGNMEIVAFARAKRVDVKVHQVGEPVWIISGLPPDEQQQQVMEDGSRPPALQIVYHSWEHYSSCSELVDGPLSQSVDPATDVLPANKPASDPLALTELEKAVMENANMTDLKKVRRLLKRFKGDPGKAVDFILSERERKTAKGGSSSSPSAPKAGFIEQTIPLNDSTLPPNDSVNVSSPNAPAALTPSDKACEVDPATEKPVSKSQSRKDKQVAARKERKARALDRKAGQQQPDNVPVDNVGLALKAIQI